MSTPVIGERARRVHQLRELLGRHADRLGLQATSLRSPRPGVLTARSDAGELLTIEISLYPRGQW
ncbi:MAG: hypothetical protein ABI140_07320 [Jatrophihabitantaceae bacterium]